jgi:cysteine synthase A
MNAHPAPSVVETIGQTPLVELSRLVRREGADGRILAKLDYLLPGSSKKDRIARQMIEDAETSGDLQPGQLVVELTSGNAGTGLAIVCAVKGYPFVAVMSRGNSEERARMMAALGAEVVLVDQLPTSEPGRVSGGDLELVERETRRIVKERGAFRADQFVLEGSRRAHYLHTGPEFIEQSGGIIGVFCDFVGSGGTFGGCSAAFKEHDPTIRCYVVEPETAAVLAGKEVTDPGHPIQGGGYSMPELKFVDPDLVDGYLQVSASAAVETARKLARCEGIFAGFSSGANVAAALQLLRTTERGKTVGVMICDSGLKYLSTDLWEAPQ